jgi:hypothetical protein
MRFIGSSAVRAKVETTAIRRSSTMIGLGPHEMDAWFWVFNIGLTAILVLLAVLSVVIAVRATRDRPPQSGQRGQP